MALLTTQVLFVRRVDDRALIDVIVLERAEAPSSPPVGAPMCFEFGLPKDTAWRDVLERRLRAWADALAIVTIDLRHFLGRTTVCLTSAGTTVKLSPITA
jgi:hypothetical protein